MTKIEKIIISGGIELLVEKKTPDNAVEIVISMGPQSKEGDSNAVSKCFLHWGIQNTTSSLWQAPPRTIWPEGTRVFDHRAVQTLFSSKDGCNAIIVHADQPLEFRFISFVLFFEAEGRWDNNLGKNYQIEMPGSDRTALTPAAVIEKETERRDVTYCHVYEFANGDQLAIAVTNKVGVYRIDLITDISGQLVLHWGVAVCSRSEWLLPPAVMRPPGTEVKDVSAETMFAESDGQRRIHIEVSELEAPMGILFVLRRGGEWIKEQGRNFYMPVVMPQGSESSIGTAEMSGIVGEIVKNETARNSWTLMHRFNLCFDLLDRVGRNDTEGLALICVWLRFSAIRQLDWQRNYNTKPSELGHAMDRLTLKLAARYSAETSGRELIRLIMTTLGRGSNAQKVRDEVLNIMHRHHVKEVSGHFMEEWHQKLHNNTTPDDIIICEAYLEFMRSNGSIDCFYRRLEQDGVTREMLESYERPIRSNPDFIPYLKDGLIHDFENFLGILKEVHNGADLGTAISTCRYLFDADMHGLMDFIWLHRNDRGDLAVILVEKATEARRRLAPKLSGLEYIIRDILFLDIALEEFVRVVVERDLGGDLDGDRLADLISTATENVRLSGIDEEIEKCSRHWGRIKDMARFGREWSLEAKALLDRLLRALGGFIDRYYTLLQPKAEFLGRAFHATRWSVDLFSEEIVRGRPAFVLSMLIRLLDPILRRSADVGDWQIISRSTAIGKVEAVGKLKSIQGKSFNVPAVVVTDSIGGDEEVPQGVVAIITPAVIDVLAHLSVRARNAGILFATCYEAKTVVRLKALAGRFVKVEVSSAGDVIFDESSWTGEDLPLVQLLRTGTPALSLSDFSDYAITMYDFTDRNVGGKSYHLKPLRGMTAGWLNFPISVALPFGVCEKVLSEEINRDILRQCEELAEHLKAGKTDIGDTLSLLRRAILELNAPDELINSLRKVMKKVGLPWPHDWENIWTCIKRVWASKWNKRAYLSRRANGILHEKLFMAVLIQEVVEAEYSFVIHTVNPFTGISDEIYAEVVIGLGETLVGNYPGKALSFTRIKNGKEPKLLSFPGKSIGLFGGGLIFRSDSNGEDLEGFAGAGLYDSFLLEPYRRVTLDYIDNPLIIDERFRKGFLNAVADIGVHVEKALGLPQDIEGAYSKGKYFVVQTRPQVGI